MRKLYAWTYRHLLAVSVSFAGFMGLMSLCFYFSKGLQLAYNDAESHLNIARRIVDSLTPGIVQIGSTWLPLLHILELPFIWNNFLWHSGLAGTIVSFICFIGSVWFVFKTIELISQDKWSAFIGVVIFIANANMLYMQTAAMFEPLLIVTMLGTIYFLLQYLKTDNKTYLIASSFFAMLSSLSRYDGWPLLLIAAAFIFIYSLIYKKFSTAKGLTLFYITLGGLGIFLWLVYNQVIFGNPFYFAYNEYSAFSQQAAIASRGNLPTKGNLLLSLEVFSSAVILNQGIFLTIVCVIGIIFYTIKNNLSPKSWGPYLLLIPFVFNIYALFKGHSVIWLPNLPPYFKTFFNVRYGLLLLPAVSVFSAYLTRKHWFMKGIVFVAIIFQIMMFYSILPNRVNHLSFVLLRDTVASITQPTRQASSWLNKHYKGGLVLISSASSETFIFNSGLDIKKFITEGTGHYWTDSLKMPSKYAEWIVLFPSFSDRVGKALKDNPDLNNKYSLVYQNGTYFIFKKNDNSLTTHLVNPEQLWKVQSVDTASLSRDQARLFFTNKNYAASVLKQLNLIKKTGANYVSIETPYDKEFIPVISFWANNAHKLGLHVWFKGNFSSWQGWFNYPKNLTPAKLLSDAGVFITSNPSLFVSGDSFTPADSAENGGPWNPVSKTNIPDFRAFLLNESTVCKKAFLQIKKDVNCNWLSMSADVAQSVLDQKTVDGLGSLVTISRLSTNREDINKYVDQIHYRYGASILLGEFGMPDKTKITSIIDQVGLTSDFLDGFYTRSYVYGVNFRAPTGALSLQGKDLNQIGLSVEKFYEPGLLAGKVIGKNSQAVVNGTVSYKNIAVKTNNQGDFSLLLPAGVRSVTVSGDGMANDFATYIKINGLTTYDPILEEETNNSTMTVDPEEYLLLTYIQKHL